MSFVGEIKPPRPGTAEHNEFLRDITAGLGRVSGVLSGGPVAGLAVEKVDRPHPQRPIYKIDTAGSSMLQGIGGLPETVEIRETSTGGSIIFVPGNRGGSIYLDFYKNPQETLAVASMLSRIKRHSANQQ